MLRHAALNSELSRVIQRISNRGERVIIDYARENVNAREAPMIRDITETMVSAMPPGSMCALKLTSFGSEQSPERACEHASHIIDVAKDKRIRVCLDAEDVLYPETCYELMRRHNTVDVPHVYNTYQMYRRDGLVDMCRDADSAKKDGFMIGLKLVRGAYLRRQRGLFGNKSETDAQFDEAVRRALTTPHAHTFATQRVLLALASEYDRRPTSSHSLGLGRPLRSLIRYVPYGTFYELFPYLLRRLRERMSWERYILLKRTPLARNVIRVVTVPPRSMVAQRRAARRTAGVRTEVEGTAADACSSRRAS